MPGRVFDVALMMAGAVLVALWAVALGAAYHVSHAMLWKSGMWFPVFPGIVSGLLVALAARLWGKLAVVGRKALTHILAFAACVLVAGTRYALAGMSMRSRAPSESLWQLMERYLTQESGRRFVIMGNSNAVEHNQVYWAMLGLELLALFFVAWRMLPDDLSVTLEATAKARASRASGLVVALLILSGVFGWAYQRFGSTGVENFLERLSSTGAKAEGRPPQVDSVAAVMRWKSAATPPPR